MVSTTSHRSGRDRIRGLLGALVGAAVAFVCSALVYEWLAPILEATGGWMRELKGPLWNIVPLLTAVGVVVGWRLASRRG